MENKELLGKLGDYVDTLESKANGYDKIMEFFYHDKRLNPIYTKIRDEILRDNCQSSTAMVRATIDHLLDKIEDLDEYERLYDEIKYKKPEELQESVLIPISSKEIKVISMIYNNAVQLGKIPLSLFIDLIGLSEEEYQIIINKFKRLGLYESGEPAGHLTEKGKKFFEGINIDGK